LAAGFVGQDQIGEGAADIDTDCMSAHDHASKLLKSPFFMLTPPCYANSMLIHDLNKI
jgi:hypothetical protein